MIRVAIVEDEKEDARRLLDCLHQFEKDSAETFKITQYTDGDALLQDYHAQFDFILTDVKMKLMDGISAAEEIRKLDSEVVIIFITNMAQYAIRGYAVDAFDYILKPVSYFAFSERLSKAIERMKKREKKTLTIKTRGCITRVDVSDIYYVESQRHVIFWHTASGIYESAGRMMDIEEKLSQLNFRRGNKGYLINLEHVEGMKGDCAIVKGEMLVISRARRKNFIEELAEYWGEVIK